MDNTSNTLPKRKHARLRHYDYSTAGAYFVTICTRNKRLLLSTIVAPSYLNTPSTTSQTVGRGLAPADMTDHPHGNTPSATPQTVGRGLAPAVELTPLGKIAEEQIALLEERFPFIMINDYVIMPNHIHAIIIFKNQTAGASPRPTLTDIVCAYKSLTTRACKKISTLESGLFQTSFHEHVVRNKHDHDAIVKYIYENPINWFYDKYYQDT